MALCPVNVNLLLQLQTVKRPLDKNNNVRLRSKKCLFGPADPTDTLRMVKENFDEERRRFHERFGIHIEDLDRLAEEQENCGKLKNKLVKRVLKPYNRDNNQQTKMTDFCVVKKRSPTNSNQGMKGNTIGPSSQIGDFKMYQH